MSLTEEDFKKYLIEELNKVNLGWIDGDEDSHLNKTADLINKSLSIAIEIKDDKTFKFRQPSITGEMIGQKIDLANKSEQFKADARDANKKFRNYPNFKTALLIRTELINIPNDIIGYIFSGLRRFVKPADRLIEIGRKNKSLSRTNTEEIGAYLLFGNNEYYYIKNPNAKLNRVLTESDIKKIFGIEIKNIPIQAN